MQKLFTLPHRVCESTCYSNGLEDLLAWRGAVYSKYLLPVLGGIAGFTYLRIKRAEPPCMVFWGANTKYLMKDLAKIIGFQEKVVEGRSFEFTFSQLKKSLNSNQPVVAGALDMYFLPYYRNLYMKFHIPIHYVLVVGYDDEKQTVFVHDCSYSAVQEIPYLEFEKSLGVIVPGMSLKNTIRIFSFPDELPSELEIAQRGFAYKAERFLNPPVKIFGVPAMRRLAKEIYEWDNKRCFEHMVTYATTPPSLPTTFENSHGMRFWQADVLSALGNKHKISNWIEAAALFRKSGENIKRLCQAALSQDKHQICQTLMEIADMEEDAYKLIKKA